MNNRIEPVIAVFAGGTSAEREVSLGSGIACAEALAKSFKTEYFQVDKDAIPAGIDPRRHVVFSTLHGTFGEDGGMQRLLDLAGVHYAGCDAVSSALAMDKTATKQIALAAGVPVIPGFMFTVEGYKPSAAEIVAKLGEDLVLKPNGEGSSVGLHMIDNQTQLELALQDATRGKWIVEQRVRGRELAVGVLNGRAMGIVEIRPKSGVYDYASKYTKGLTEYLAPAPLDAKLTEFVRNSAEKAYAACGCRDFTRVDFMLSAENAIFLLEINTLPGMKETSLFPKSAQCVGLDFVTLVKEMVAPALERFCAGRK